MAEAGGEVPCVEIFYTRTKQSITICLREASNGLNSKANYINGMSLAFLLNTVAVTRPCRTDGRLPWGDQPFVGPSRWPPPFPFFDACSNVSCGLNDSSGSDRPQP
ncbi:hypothetical protein ACCAA_130009 [Candidatus Accumulibacter aalborgensis]|uniref:Uncharacterized protein n=1 Tax=Candidatus Accumulibacter aalborgensis TaxID=1860102 RepID=A0A1A8XFQ7_9PROT|nr:hypothetical protein ACCAA_130009 [Candidatus Accumulibacter aalborgensis]